MIIEKRNIRFDATLHKYTDEYNKTYISVTQLLGKLEEPFDSEYWSMYKSLERSGYTIRPSKDREILVYISNNWCKYSLPALYCGVLSCSISAFQIQNEWKETTEESCIWGTERHDSFENSINSVYDTRNIVIHDIQNKGFALKIKTVQELEDSGLKNLPSAIYEKLVVYIKAGWTLYAEKRVYNSHYQVAGTIDLFLVKNKQIIVFDWKTNKHKLEFRSGYYKKDWNKERTKKVKTNEFVEKDERFLKPLNHIKKSKGNGYTLQISMYAYLCELWGFQICGLVLCHIRPELDENSEPKLVNGRRVELLPEFYRIEYLKSDIKKLLEWYKKHMN